MSDETERERLRRLRREAAEAEDYPCGYAKPPLANRFSSTNQPRRARRPRKSRNERISKIADETLSVKVGGVPRRMTRHEAVVRKLCNDALAGDTRAVRLWLADVGKLPATPKADSGVDYGAEVIRKLDEMAARKKQVDEDFSTWSSEATAVGKGKASSDPEASPE